MEFTATNAFTPEALPSTGWTMVQSVLIGAVPRPSPHTGLSFAIGSGMTEVSFLTTVAAPTLTAKPGPVGKPLSMSSNGKPDKVNLRRSTASDD